jgi:hypothetical protein
VRLTHVPGYFQLEGLSIVPHLWIPEKVFTDCVKGPRCERCGQYAMAPALGAAGDLICEPAVNPAGVGRHA